MATYKDDPNSSGFWREFLSPFSGIPCLNVTEERALANQQRAIKAANGICEASVSILAILNILSLAHASAQQPQPTDVHVFYLNPQQLLYGDHLNKEYTPFTVCENGKRRSAT
jgi:hypothetical protein